MLHLSLDLLNVSVYEQKEEGKREKGKEREGVENNTHAFGIGRKAVDTIYKLEFINNIKPPSKCELKYLKG